MASGQKGSWKGRDGLTLSPTSRGWEGWGWTWPTRTCHCHIVFVSRAVRERNRADAAARLGVAPGSPAGRPSRLWQALGLPQLQHGCSIVTMKGKPAVQQPLLAPGLWVQVPAVPCPVGDTALCSLREPLCRFLHPSHRQASGAAGSRHHAPASGGQGDSALACCRSSPSRISGLPSSCPVEVTWPSSYSKICPILCHVQSQVSCLRLFLSAGWLLVEHAQ